MDRHHTFSRARRRAVTLVVAVVAVAATGNVAAPATGAASDNALNVTAGEYVYQTKGAPKPGLVTINFKNAGTEYHMLVMGKVKPGVTVAQVKAAATSNDPNAGDAVFDSSGANQGFLNGLPNIIGPKQQTTTTVKVPAGRYALMCFVTAPDGMVHAAHGMVKIVEVKGTASAQQPPTTQATVKLNDNGIDFPLTNPGHNVSLKVTNSGTASHDFTLVKLATGKTIDDAKAYFDGLFSGQNPSGDAPAVIVGGVAELAPGTTGYLQQTLAPGRYGYASTVSNDGSDGNPAQDDFANGLKGEFTVK
jgi:hypothetical protein